MVAPKHPNNNNGLLRIRFKYNGTHFALTSLGRYDDKIAYDFAQNICDRIKRDINNGVFTPTNNAELTLKYNPSAIHKTINKKIVEEIKHAEKFEEKEVVDVRKKCIAELRDSKKVVEKNILSHLRDYDKKLCTKKDVQNFVEWLQNERKLSGVSIARYFDTLRTIDDIFREVRIERNVKPLPKPFSKEEVAQVLAWFRAHNFDYYKYVYFLFSTGCRTSEAIGLRWKHVDLENKVIVFYETLARNNNNSSNRVVKTTKKNILRKFPMNQSLCEFFASLNVGEKEELVFTFNGHCIDDKNFRNRYWVRCLKECDIEYRKPYNTRHTFITHFLEQTKDVVKCASLTHGSKSGVKTIWEHYAGIINKVEVPELF
jgi:integrase